MNYRILALLATLTLLACGPTAGTEAGPPNEVSAGDENVAAGSQAEAETDSELPNIGLPNELHPRAGLITGGQPDAAAFEAARDAGVALVITLRTEGEAGSDAEAQALQSLGIEFVSIPVAGAEGLTEDNARTLDAALRAATGPVVLHCGSGNRVGALMALRAHFVDGVSPEEALIIGQAHGLTRLEGAVRQRLGLAEAVPIE